MIWTNSEMENWISNFDLCFWFELYVEDEQDLAVTNVVDNDHVS